jgi:nucleotide-binding universal stress UspA family protein
MYQRILVPVDGSATSSRGLQEAIHLARQSGGQIRLMHVVNQMPHAFMLDAYSSFAGNWLGSLRAEGEKLLQATRAVVAAAGVPVDAVQHEGFQRSLYEFVEDEVVGWKADLIVIGTHGRRGVERMLLGSDAERIVRSASVPVLLIRLPEPVAVKAAEGVPETVHVRIPSAALAFE